jgi:adenylate kinase family enzyme
MNHAQEALIVITGLPASGKTSLGRALAVELGLPFIDKDDILESLFDTIGVASTEDRSRLSRASDAVMQTLASTAVGAVLTSHWRREEVSEDSGTPTDWLRARPAGTVIEVYCDCPPSMAADRFAERIRHPGHFDDNKTLANLVVQFESLAALGPWNLGTLIRAETSEPVDTTMIARAVRGVR